MALPAFLGALAAHQALAETSGILLKPLHSLVNAKMAPTDVFNHYDAFITRPIIVPEPGDLLNCLSRDLLDLSTAKVMLGQHGVNYGLKRRTFHDRRTSDAWLAVSRLHQHVPGHGEVMEAWVRRLITDDDARRLMKRAGADVEAVLATEPWRWGRPSEATVLHAYLRDVLPQDRAEALMTEAGSRLDLWQEVLPALYEQPGLVEVMAARNRNVLSDSQFRDQLRRLGFRGDGQEEFYDRMRLGIPGVSDLLRMISRQLFSPDVVGDYGLYQGYDQRASPYFRQLGLDYPLPFQVQTERGMEQATLPLLYWAMTREILSLGQAYQAYQRLRPDQIRRWQNEIPNLRPFTIDDLRFHLRVAGYPPPMQDYQIALSHPPIGVRAIAQASQFLNVPRAWVFNRYLDLGFREDDAALQADLQEARKAYAASAVERSVAQSVQKQTIGMIEGLYEDGILDHQGALGQLADAGYAGPLAVQMLDLVDFRVERSLIKAAVGAVRRDYLSGELSGPEAQAQLQRIGIAGGRQQNYLAAWTIQRTGRRRRLETGKILSLAGKGMLPYDEARRRLANLGWDDPDAVLLLAEAEATLRDREQRAAKASDREAKARSRELERLAKLADQQAAKLRAERNRVAPRSVLYTWLKDAVISEDEFRSMMRDRGYPDDLIEDYVRQSKVQKPRVIGGDGAAGSGRATPKPRHPGVSMLVSQWRDAIITDEQLDEGLEALGYSEEDRGRIREEAEIAGKRGERFRLPPSPPSEE